MWRVLLYEIITRDYCIVLCLGAVFPVSTVAASFVGPAFLKEPPSRVDFANDTGARIDCSAGGSPPPSVSWLSGDGKPVGPIPQTRELLPNGSLFFPPFRPSGYRHDVHAATYRCVAENSLGRIHSRDVRVRAGESSLWAPGNRLPLMRQHFAAGLNGCDVRFEVLTAILPKMRVLWDVILCRWVGGYRIVAGLSVFFFRVKQLSLDCLKLNLKALRSFETFGKY